MGLFDFLRKDTLNEIKEAIVGLKESFDNLLKELGETKDAILAKLAEEQARIAELKQIIADGGSVTAEQIDAVAAGQQALQEQIAAMPTDPPTT